MELARMSNQGRIKLCRRYFYIGFLALPFLWIVNTVWFGMFLINYESYQQQRRQQQKTRMNRRIATTSQQEQSRREPIQRQSMTSSPSSSTRQTNSDDQLDQQQMSDETKKHLREIRSLVIYSFIGSFVWMVGITAWIITYQLKRAEWGEWGDEISFNIPRGIP